MVQEGKKVGISYCRKSILVKDMSDDQSVNYQQEAINRYAEHHGITIIKQYNDIGYSGKNTNRPDLKMMLEDLHSGEDEVDYLLFYSVDRLGRDLESNIDTILKITEYVKTVISVSEQLTNDAEYFKAFFLLLTGYAQTEREHLLHRMADGRNAKIVNRKSFNGSYLPLGYVKSHSGDKERLVPALIGNTDDYGEMQGLVSVQFIFYSYLEGMSLRKIASFLDRYFGLTRRQTKWNHKAVRYILTNTAYIGDMHGMLRQNENYYIECANIEPIVDSLMFKIIQNRLEFERTGRDMSISSRLPLFNLCLNCASPLIRKGNRITCPSCENSVESKSLLHVLANSFQRVLERRGIETFQNQISDLIRSYEWRRKKMVDCLKDLNERYTIIQEISDRDVHAKKDMIHANTIESTKIQSELQEVEAILQLCMDKRSSKDIKRGNAQIPLLLFSTRLIRLAYLIFVNMEATVIDDKEIIIVFHQDLSGGGQSNE